MQLGEDSLFETTGVGVSFRRSKDEATRTAQWSRFKADSTALLIASGLPGYAYESERRFQLFLMHGCLDGPDRPLDFSVRDLNDSQRASLRELVVLYLASGFGDPGLSVFGPVEDEKIRQEALRRQ